MSIDFYYISLSTPCRSVMMTTAYMAGVDVNLKLLNLMNQEPKPVETGIPEDKSAAQRSHHRRRRILFEREPGHLCLCN